LSQYTLKLRHLPIKRLIDIGLAIYTTYHLSCWWYGCSYDCRADRPVLIWFDSRQL